MKSEQQKPKSGKGKTNINALKFDIVCSSSPWPPQPETHVTWRKVATIMLPHED